jgi:hypothetical protein
MSEPIIAIDPSEAQEIERNTIMQKTFYQPTGYHSNARLLYNDLKKQGHKFPYGKSYTSHSVIAYASHNCVIKCVTKSVWRCVTMCDDV